MAQADVPESDAAPFGPLWGGGRIALDAQAARLLRYWANRPWDLDCRFPLADRIEELGEPVAAGCVRQGYHCRAAIVRRDVPRRARQRELRLWRTWLKRTFGDWDANTLPCEVPADTPPILPPYEA